MSSSEHVRIDPHYTPDDLASVLAAQLTGTSDGPLRIADFAVGAGALLRAVVRRFPEASAFGTDISEHAVTALRAEHPEWSVEVCDFLDDPMRNSCAVTRAASQYDAVVLNPPFSYRGNASKTVTTAATGPTNASPAAAFVLLATRFVPKGELVAILPLSTLRSERDERVWTAVDREFEIEILDEYGRGTFPGLAAATVLVRLRGRCGAGALRVDALGPSCNARPIAAQLVRGCLPMHQVREQADGYPLVHTTGMTRNGLVFIRVGNSEGRRVRGPAVLVPRVGRPAVWKVQRYEHGGTIVLSDCVIAVQCQTRKDCIEVAKRLQSSWEMVRHAWCGSCAPYVTIARLKAVLGELGVMCGLEASTAQAAAVAGGFRQV